MIRIIISALVGGIVIYIWAFVSWMFIPWHLMGALPAEDAVRTVLRETGAESGVYHVPMIDHGTYADLSDDAKKAAEDAFTEKHQEGPVAFLTYKADGSHPLSPVTMIIGFVLEVLVAAVAAVLLTMAAPALPGFAARVGFVVLLGVFVIVAAHLMNWNYMHYPTRFTLEVAADGIVASLLLGIVLAIFIKPYANIGAVDDLSGVDATAE